MLPMARPGHNTAYQCPLFVFRHFHQASATMFLLLLSPEEEKVLPRRFPTSRDARAGHDNAASARALRCHAPIRQASARALPKNSWPSRMIEKIFIAAAAYDYTIARMPFETSRRLGNVFLQEISHFVGQLLKRYFAPLRKPVFHDDTHFCTS